MEQTVLHNQSLLDIAIQVDGSVFNVVNWSLANGISVTEALNPGTKLIAPKNKENAFDQVAQFFKNKAITIGTFYTAPEPEPTLINYEFPQGEFPISF